MAEGKVVVSAVVTDQQSLSAKRVDGVIQLFAARHVSQLLQLESLPDDAYGLQHVLFRICEPVEPSCKHRVDALRHTDLFDRPGGSPALPFVDQVPFINKHVDELFAEKGRASGAFNDLGA